MKFNVFFFHCTDIKSLNQYKMDDEIRNRLALLKGETSAPSEKKVADIHKLDTRSNEEKISDLLKKFKDESDLDVHLDISQPSSNTVQGIEERLSKLRGGGPSSANQNPRITLTEHSGISEVDKIIKRVRNYLFFSNLILNNIN